MADGSFAIWDPTTNQITFLIDEIEAHLHPKWQLKIIASLRDVMNGLGTSTNTQLIAATHSPLVLASVESFFDPSKDAWFDLDYIPNSTEKVRLTQKEFEPMGDFSNWLTSEAFDLPSARNTEIGRLLDKAAALMENGTADAKEVEKTHQELP